MESGTELDGYTLLRVIGEGGFGKVWLVQSSFTGEFKALKLISGSSAAETKREFDGLMALKEKAPWLNKSGIMPVEHANSLGNGFFYIMPLSDGTDSNITPDDSNWKPYTLAYLLEAHRAAGSWLSSNEIIYYISELITGATALEEVGLVHRDIKPENVLSLQGRPVLSDCSLIGSDKLELTRRGTPGYSAPSYYVESGGSPDMYGLGALLYTLLTGRNPDSSNLTARRAFWWPPIGEEALSEAEKREWLRLKNVVLKALDEENRYATFSEFSQALAGAKSSEPVKSKSKLPLLIIVAVCLILLVGVFLLTRQYFSSSRDTSTPTGISQVSSAVDEVVREAEASLKAYKDSIADKERRQSSSNVIQGLEKIDVNSPDAIHQLDEFITQFSSYRFAGNKSPKAENTKTLKDLYAYVGAINRAAKTPEEKKLAMTKAADFNLKLTPLLNGNTEKTVSGIQDEVTIVTTVQDLVIKRQNLSSDRIASLQKDPTANASAIQDEKTEALQFEEKVNLWLKSARGE